MGYHVLAIDYRGYGDSDWFIPSQTSMVEDARAAFDFLNCRAHPLANIFIWGHSLGTGVTSKLAHDLSIDENVEQKPKGLILEAPFNRMLDEVQTFKASRILPFLGFSIDHVLSRADMSFDNRKWLKEVNEPVLILHAEDDGVIPFDLGKKLFQDLKDDGNNVQLHPFQEKLALGHDGIFMAQVPESLSVIITRFINDSTQFD